MVSPILHGFRNLPRFSGRDSRRHFWPHVGMVFALVFVASFVLMAFTMAQVFQEMSAFAAAHPEAATVQSGPGHYSVQIDAAHPEAPIPALAPFTIGFPIMVLFAVLLLAAAVSRRLHDRNMRAWWGLLPVPFLTAGMIGFPILMTDAVSGDEPDLGLFGLLFLNNLLYMVALVTLIVLLAQRGTEGPNRFGPAPETARRD